MKVYVLTPRYDHVTLEEVYYNNYEERCEKTKGIPSHLIFEEEELDKAIDIVYELNRL